MAIFHRFLLFYGLLSLEVSLPAEAACVVDAISTTQCTLACKNNDPLQVLVSLCPASPTFTGTGPVTSVEFSNSDAQTTTASLFAAVTIETLGLYDTFTGLDAETLASISGMTTLEISNNAGLSTLPAAFFDGAGTKGAELITLRIENNAITSVEGIGLSSLASLTLLSLSGNGIESLMESEFTGLTQLRNLILSNNQLSSLPTRIFSGLPLLEQLSIEGNSISCFSSTLFQPLTSLNSLPMGSQTESPMGICAQTFKSQTGVYITFDGEIDYCAITCSAGAVTGEGWSPSAAVGCDCDSNEGCIIDCEKDCLVDAPLGENMVHGGGCLMGAIETSNCQNQCVDGYGYGSTPVPSTQCVNGAWTPNTLNDCVEKNCPQPAPFGENMIKGTSNCEADTMHGLVCQHACVTGYEYNGSMNPPPITCQLGEWMPGSIDPCSPMICVDAAPIDQGTMTVGSDCGGNAVEGTVCQQTCNSDLEYTPGAGDDPPAVQCRSGSWSLSTLSPCTAILCRTPAPLANNMKKGLTGCDVNSPLDSTCQHTCLDGFLYEGDDNPPLISCINGAWNPASISSCDITTCVDAAPIDADTMMIGSGCGANQEHGSVCQHTCNSGLEYTLDARDQPPAVECVSGTWSPDSLNPCRVKRCNTPAPFNANMIMGSTNCTIDTAADSICQHACKTGFEYEGSDNPPDITCINGEWDPSSILPCAPTLCLNAALGDAETMDLGSNCTTNQEHGTICQHTCKDGFEYTSDAGDDPPPMQCLSGTWTPNTIHPCIPQTCKVPAPYASNMVAGASGCDIDSPDGATCQHTCKNGYVYQSPTMHPPLISCIGGAWDPVTIMSCIAITCANSAPIDANTMVMGPGCGVNQEHGSICQQTCNAGMEYTIDARDQPPAVECVSGTWSPAILTPCTVKRCKSPAPLGDNMVRGDQGCNINAPGGSTCQHSCKAGYIFPGADSPPEIACSNGEWSPITIESCIKYDCGLRPSAANTRLAGTTGTTYGKTTTFECIGLTFAPNGATTQTIVCNESGQWTSLYACTGGVVMVRLTLDQEFSPALADETSTEHSTLCQAFYSEFEFVIPQRVIGFECLFREGSLVVSLTPVGESTLSLLEETQVYLGIQNTITRNQNILNLDANQPEVVVTHMELVRNTISSSGSNTEIILDIYDACALYNEFQVCKCEVQGGLPECLDNSQLITYISVFVGLLALIIIVVIICCVCVRRGTPPKQPIAMQQNFPIVSPQMPVGHHPRTLGRMADPVIPTIRKY